MTRRGRWTRDPATGTREPGQRPAGRPLWVRAGAFEVPGGGAADPVRFWRASRLTGYGVVLAAVIVAAVPILLVLHGWRVQRAMVERDLRDRMSDAAQILADGIADHTQLVGTYLLAPVIGARRSAPGEREAERLPLETLGAGAGRRHLPWRLRQDPMLGWFRFEAGPARPAIDAVETAGALRDRRILRALIADLNVGFWQPHRKNDVVAASLVHLDGRDVSYLVTCERAADGTPLSVVGVTFTRALEARRAVGRLLATQPLLPSTFSGVEWRTGAPRSSEAPGASANVGEMDAALNALLLVEVSGTATGRIHATPEDPAAWDTPYVGAFTIQPGYHMRVRVAFPRAAGDRLVSRVVAQGSREWLLAGIALISAAFVAAVFVEVRRQRQLTEARRAFVSAISHELRTPLTHIGALSETLLVGGAENAAQERRWLAAIHREAHRLGRLAENVMLHARGERAVIPLSRSWTRVADLVDDVVGSADAMARARGARVVAHVPEDMHAHVDAGALRQILLNLVDNAIKYGPDGQRVAVTVHAPTATRPMLCLFVDDEGPGVAPEDRRRIWSAFERVGDRGGATGGSGLGLSVVHTLVRAHGGRAWVEDASTGGARFAVELPQPEPTGVG